MSKNILDFTEFCDKLKEIEGEEFDYEIQSFAYPQLYLLYRLLKKEKNRDEFGSMKDLEIAERMKEDESDE